MSMKCAGRRYKEKECRAGISHPAGEGLIEQNRLTKSATSEQEQVRASHNAADLHRKFIHHSEHN